MLQLSNATVHEINQYHAEECKRRGCTWFVTSIKTGLVSYHKKRGNSFPAGLVRRAVRGCDGKVGYQWDD